MKVQWSLDGKRWNPTSPTALLTAITANGSTIHPAFSTVSVLGVKMRSILSLANTAATLGTATISLFLIYRFPT